MFPPSHSAAPAQPPVAAPIPEGMNLVVDNRLVMSDGSHPIAWVDAGGNVLPVEKHQPLSFLPPGAEYLFTPDDVRAALSSRVLTGVRVKSTVAPSEVAHATGEAPPPKVDPRPALSRRQLVSALDSPTGSPAFRVR